MSSARALPGSGKRGWTRRASAVTALARRVLAMAALVASVVLVFAPACTRTVCEEAIDICGEPVVDEFDGAVCDGAFECTSRCIVDNDTCVTNQLDACLAECER